MKKSIVMASLVALVTHGATLWSTAQGEAEARGQILARGEAQADADAQSSEDGRTERRRR